MMKHRIKIALQEVKAMVQKAGYRCAVTTVMDSESDLFELNRIAFTDRVTPGGFAVTLSEMFGRVSRCYWCIDGTRLYEV
ncbi:MAG: hypothetical protein K9M57_04530 [Phycisphaerae bacterium]|nr:hypothetical protein [Phycisphaerae bacterium]